MKSNKPQNGHPENPPSEPLEFDFAGPEGTFPTGPVSKADSSIEKEAPSATERLLRQSRSSVESAPPSKPSAPAKPEPEITPPTRSKSMPSNIQPPTVNDFRKNAERQSREQKSVGSLLSVVAYSLLAAVIVVGGLAGFGGYVLWKQIQAQSVTVAQLDEKYATQVDQLKVDIEAGRTELAQQIARVNAQQQKVNQLTASLEETAALLKTERLVRGRDDADLQRRVRRLEGR